MLDSMTTFEKQLQPFEVTYYPQSIAITTQQDIHSELTQEEEQKEIK